MLTLETLLSENLNIDIAPAQIAAFEQYQNVLLEWNQKFNLTTISDPQEMQLKHFYDSLTCLRAIPPEAKSLIDIGCGAGLPGIPLKIMLPGLKLVLADSVGKKVEFCRMAAQELGLTDVTALHTRAEDLGQDKDHREQYDWAVARAVAPLPVLAEYLLPLVRVGGSMLAQKGSSAAGELEQANKAIRVLGGGQAKLDTFELPVTHDQRALIQVVKERNTPAQYPRKAGTPSKKPLG